MQIKPKAVIFDLDGVITETSKFHFEAWKIIASELGIQTDQLNPIWVNGLSREECLESLLKIAKKKITDEEKQNLLDKKNKLYIDMLNNKEIKVFQPMVDAINDLRKKDILIALASISKNANLIISKLKLENLFDYIVNPEEVINLKPAPDVFLNAANHFNLRTNECWAVEDSQVGVQSIKAANIFAIGIGSELNEVDVKLSKHDEFNYEDILEKYNKYLETPILQLENISKVYPNGVQSIFDFCLDVKRNEFITLIGPSGCGKTTTLRMIAGLEDITSGNLIMENKISNDVASKDRNIAMVFQNYALYPHMSVRQNIDFGLRIKKVKKDIIEQKLRWAENVLDLKNYMYRKPKELSGGQRQRVALGRAIVRDAKIFLMDEPLANLDAKLRQKMRKEIKKLHNSLGVNTIYVTHDQTEAMTMSDRVVVMSEGLIQQVGTPHEIYNKPSNAFVAKFIGDTEINMLEFTLNDGKISEYNIELFKNVKKFETKLKAYNKKKILLGIRPEDVQIGKESLLGMTYPFSKIDAVITFIENLGSKLLIHTQTKNGEEITTESDRHFIGNIGDKIELFLNIERAHFFDKETEFNISIENNVETNNALEVIKKSKRDVLSNKLIMTHKSRIKKSVFTKLKELLHIGNKKNTDENEMKMQTILEQIKDIDRKEGRIND